MDVTDLSMFLSLFLSTLLPEVNGQVSLSEDKKKVLISEVKAHKTLNYTYNFLKCVLSFFFTQIFHSVETAMFCKETKLFLRSALKIA